MVKIQFDLTEENNYILRLYMIKNSLSSKGEAINAIIKEGEGSENERTNFGIKNLWQ